MPAAPTFYEFFAGGGMARAGLGPGWRCVFANDHDPVKAASYRANWGGEHLRVADVASIEPSALPGRADLAWASFPCQDLSLAGGGLGLGEADGARTRSGTFWPFWALMRALVRDGRGPRAIVLENVPGALTSRGGRDFAAMCAAPAAEGYRLGALVIDAARFVPQSRARVFLVAVAPDVRVAAGLAGAAAAPGWTTPALLNAHAALPGAVRDGWLWWRLPAPPPRSTVLADLIEDHPSDVSWDAPERTVRLLAMMSTVNRAKVDAARRGGARAVGALYRRTRPAADAARRQSTEVRFDGVAGCLRTPAGGSSRQTILTVEGDDVRSRLLSARETARLMGLDDGFVLPSRYNDACRLTGDGVCAPAVGHLEAGLLRRLVSAGARLAS